MRIEKFVWKNDLVLKYTRTVITTKTIGAEERRQRRTQTSHWHCEILHPIFEFSILVEKDWKDGKILVAVEEISGKFPTQKESRADLIRKIRGRKMVVKDLNGTRNISVPADLD
jgi:hypothetical protein